MPQDDPYAHVYRRIAEHVSRDLSVDVDPETVRQLIKQESMIRPKDEMPSAEVYEAVMTEAKEYGIAV